MAWTISEPTPTQPVAFCGMGLLGKNFSLKLLDRKLPLRVYNRTAMRCEPLARAGAQVAEDAQSCAKGASRVHLTLRSDASVDEVMQGLAPGFEEGQALVVDHTTTSAQGARQRQEAWGKRGVTYVHAPVFMGPQNARDASGYMLVSGDKDKVKALTSHLEPMTGKLIYVGEDPGKAAALKLIGNQMLMSITMTLADSMGLAQAHGLAREDVEQLLEAFPVGASFGRRLERLVEVDYDEPSWELRMARKDAGLMQEQTEAAGRSLPLLEAMIREMDQRMEAGEQMQDWTVVTKSSLGRA